MDVVARVLVLPLMTPEAARMLAGQKTTGGTRLPFAFSAAELELIAAGMRAGGLDVSLLLPEPLPPEAYHPGRRQWQATPILHGARKKLEALGDLSARLLVLTDADIYEPGLSFSGGMAELGGRLALVSLARLQSGDRQKLVTRAVKESLHEIGHTLGLEHCRDRNCVMFLSRSIADSDIKRAALCPKCRSVVGRAVR